MENNEDIRVYWRSIGDWWLINYVCNDNSKKIRKEMLTHYPDMFFRRRIRVRVSLIYTVKKREGYYWPPVK